tara:strand:- start:3013 stop:3498 length:486 start_codon:yes stop_codon:yes gene_type:complete
MKRGIKHLIQCHCVLPQYRKRKNPLYHKFTVFSIIDEFDQVKNKLSQCNNCDIVHNVYDICRSEIITGMEESRTIKSIAHIIPHILQSVAEILTENDCDLATWEQAHFFIENEIYDLPIVLAEEKVGGNTSIKALVLEKGNKVKVESFMRKDEIEGLYGLK